MKIILSRKGFDSGNARMPSPILPDGTPLSLPIPERKERRYSYYDLFHSGRTLGAIIEELADGKDLRFDISSAHADPDLDRERLPSRMAGWRPTFGQADADQTHLTNQKVVKGDLFLFFGWFRHTEEAGGRLRYVTPRQSFHAIFGWLQIGRIYVVDEHPTASLPDWVRYHPHVVPPGVFPPNNTIYTASDRLNLGGVERDTPGGGVFRRLTPSLRLTADGRRRSNWQLPKWFCPVGTGRTPLSYHKDEERWSWSADGEHAILRSVSRGQEFVLDTEHYPEALPWVASLFDEHTGDTKRL